MEPHSDFNYVDEGEYMQLDFSSRTMELHSDVKNVDEDGYTQLDFSSKGIVRRPVISEKGPRAASPLSRTIAVTLGILCLVALGIAVVLGALAFWRPGSGSGPLEKDNFPPGNKENCGQPTKSPLEENVVPTKALKTTGAFSSPCPHNWIRHEKSCYLFSMSLGSWHRGKNRCSLLSSNLLKIDNSRELEFIEKRVASTPDDSFWIGLSRNQTEGPWFWEDGSAFSSVLFQVRSTAIETTVPHNCAWIHVSNIYDQHCHTPSYSICEKELSA